MNSKEQEEESLKALMTMKELRWKMQMIDEPLKIRVITAGTHHLTGLRRLQRYLLNAWKKCPFGTMTSDMSNRLRFRMELLAASESSKDKGKDFISGDYDAATDGMNMDATLTCWDRIMENIGLKGSMLDMAGRRTFTDAIIEYPKEFGGGEVRQTNGQLMGHPLSFPLLCIINLSVYMRTMSILERDGLLFRSVLINGDDIVFRGDEREYNLWRRNAAEVGLAVNEMKTYRHKRFYLINSILTRAGTIGAQESREVTYYNRALAIGAKVKSEPVRLLSTADVLWNALDHPIEDVAKRGRMHLMKTIVAKQPSYFTPNWFFPKVLGGLGLPNRRGEKLYATRQQRQVATYFMRNPEALWISERVGDKPRAIELALELFRKIRPHSEDVSPSFVGPLNLDQDYSVAAQEALSRALAVTAWHKIKAEGMRNEEEIRRFFIRKALASKEKPARLGTIMNFATWRKCTYQPQVGTAQLTLESVLELAQNQYSAYGSVSLDESTWAASSSLCC
jgi:hypothetical protein